MEHDSEEHVEPDVVDEAEDTEQRSPSASESITEIARDLFLVEFLSPDLVRRNGDKLTTCFR